MTPLQITAYSVAFVLSAGSVGLGIGFLASVYYSIKEMRIKSKATKNLFVEALDSFVEDVNKFIEDNKGAKK